MPTASRLLAPVSRPVAGSLDPVVTTVAYDSRDVVSGALFCALPGTHVDGHRYIEDALRRGAVAVLCQRAPADAAALAARYHAVVYRARDARRAMSKAAAALYGEPSRSLPVIGVTGTDGKSSTTYMIAQLLCAAGVDSGFISTALLGSGNEPVANPLRQSTPEAPEIQRLLAEMLRAGQRVAVVEATSHGLSAQTQRLADVVFRAAVFTNLSHEHLEFHGSFERYRDDKVNLFRAVAAAASRPAPDEGTLAFDRFGIVNANDPHAEYFRAACDRRVFSFGIGAGDLGAYELTPRPDGVAFQLHWQGGTARALLPLLGAVSVENAVAALLAVSRALDTDPLSLAPLLATIKPLPGRMQPIPNGLGYTTIVDYAHTPGSFAKVLPGLRPSDGRLIVVFGSAGDRDTAKRPLQGELAARYADVVVLTDEDPRTEDRDAIIDQIAEGCLRVDAAIETERRLLRVPDRDAAIAAALEVARSGDVVAFLGKAHETSIIYPDGPHPWNEAAAVREAIERRTRSAVS